MRKTFLLIICLVYLSFFAKAQERKDTTVQKVKKTEIELVYNHYIQDGEHSAITGGIGTEELKVYGPSLSINNTFHKNKLSFNVGADVISSVSTDKIDFVVSSASILDTRFYTNASYQRKFDKPQIAAYGGLGVSIESDYLSIGSKLGFVKENKEKLRTYSLDLQMYNDDLRWGRLDTDVRGPQFLIYPAELRNKEWYDTYKRNSYNLKLGFSQVVNKRIVAGIYPELSYQTGVLGTPFHRVFFSDGTREVEMLPDKRFKFGLGLKMNAFVGGRFILKNTLNGYADSFGINVLSLENETAIKLKSFLTLLPSARFYLQKGSPYFAPYLQHVKDDDFHTSDYDLSSFQTFGGGFGVKYKPHKYLGKKTLFRTLILRYNFFHRTDGLQAHTISVVFDVEVKKSEKLGVKN